jgi:hypothetical protein
VDAQKLQLKIFATPDSASDAALQAVIGVFHRWIKEGVLAELLIDVANYVHVPEGPGVVLIGHASDYFLDQGEGRLGLLHNRKRSGPPPADRLDDLARRTFHAALLLEREPALANRLRFRTGELLLRVNDRRLAPDTDGAFAAMQPELESFGRRVFAGPFELTRVGGPGDLLSARWSSPTEAPLATLLERVGGPPEPNAGR